MANYESCSLCDAPATRTKYGWCEKHYYRWRRHGHPLGLVGKGGPGKRRPRRDDISYMGAHCRVRRDRGSAAFFTCRCGSAAQQWAYTHDDPNQLVTADGLAYSVDPAYYEPLCVSCHVVADKARCKSAAAR